MWQCIRCGPRTDQSDYVNQDNNCYYARNGICEDGGTGSSYYIDIDGGQAHLCGYGTDLNDCAVYGPRKIFSFGYLSYAGVTNFSYPLPPPPPPFPPPTPSPPLNISWQGCVTDPARVCYSFSKKQVGYADFACSGTAEQLYWKVKRQICSPPTDATIDLSALSYNDVRDLFLADPNLKQDCSDGGFASVAVRVGRAGHQNSEPTFGCDYGSQVPCLKFTPFPFRWHDNAPFFVVCVRSAICAPSRDRTSRHCRAPTRAGLGPPTTSSPDIPTSRMRTFKRSCETGRCCTMESSVAMAGRRRRLRRAPTRRW